MRYNLFLFLLVTLYASAQISNVHQSVNNGRIVIIYDLRGSDEDFYDIKVTATNDNGETITPRAIVGDLAVVAVGQGRSIWWEMQLDGYTPSGWKISLAANKPLDIKWIFVEGGPGGDYYISATEVTFDQYDKFCEATSYTKPEASFGRGKQPVVNVNVADAVAYCDWLSKETRTTVRLPEDTRMDICCRRGEQE